MSWSVVCADVLEWCKSYTGEPFHAILCDPPYALNFMNKAWDNNIAFQPETWTALAEHLLPGGFIMAFASSRGWHRLACAMEDAGLIIQPSIFGWLNGQGFPKATRIDTQIDKAAGKLGERKIVGKYKPPNDKEWNLKQADDSEIDAAPGTFTASGRRTLDIEQSATPLARTWEGHRYGGQILKNALEPIIVAQKPWEGKRLDCIVETGAGALNIEAARIGMASGDRAAYIEKRQSFAGMTGKQGGGWKNVSPQLSPEEFIANSAKGRWPANFCLVHSPECRRVGVKRVKRDKRGVTGGIIQHKPPGQHGIYSEFAGTDRTPAYGDSDGLETVDDFDCVPECPARRLGEQSGEREVSGTAKLGRSHKGQAKSGFLAQAERSQRLSPNDKGTAARFFFQADWQYECAEGCPVARLDEQAGERPGPWGKGQSYSKTKSWKQSSETRKIDNERFHGETGGPSRFYHNADWSHEVAERIAGVDPVRYQSKAARKERANSLDDFYWRKDRKAPIGFVRVSRVEWEALPEKERAQGNIHPTCKPVSLNRWLATLLLPPKEYAPRRILVPFSGSGSEMISCSLAGWEEVIGIEFKQDYVDIAEARLKHWLNKLRQLELL